MPFSSSAGVLTNKLTCTCSVVLVDVGHRERVKLLVRKVGYLVSAYGDISQDLPVASSESSCYWRPALTAQIISSS